MLLTIMSGRIRNFFKSVHLILNAQCAATSIIDSWLGKYILSKMWRQLIIRGKTNLLL